MKSGLNLILIRYADVLLMYAETMNELGKMDEAVWNKTIRPLRLRAGFTDAPAFELSNGRKHTNHYPSRTQTVELALEGLRIFDIRRWKTAETVLNTYPHHRCTFRRGKYRQRLHPVGKTFISGT